MRKLVVGAAVAFGVASHAVAGFRGVGLSKDAHSRSTARGGKRFNRFGERLQGEKMKKTTRCGDLQSANDRFHQRARLLMILVATVVVSAAVVGGARADCFPDLPAPALVFVGTEDFTVDGVAYTRYRLDVENKLDYPDEMFALTSDLPPCGLNDAASRTWVDIYAGDGTRIYGFCALSDNTGLGLLWFAVPRCQAPPPEVFITLWDRQCGTVYTSNRLPLQGLADCDDGNPCTVDVLNGECGCDHIPAPGAACSDGDGCTTADACDASGACIGGAALDCNDNNACTTDTCEPATGCVHEAIPSCSDTCTIGSLAPTDGSVFILAGPPHVDSDRTVPTFAWVSTCNLKYQLQFSNSHGFEHPALFVLPAQSVTATTFTPNYGNWTAILNMAKNRGGTGTIYWRVVGYRPDGETIRSSASAITIR